MANDEHVTMLKKGADAWNKWRCENPDIRPDLTGADLTEVGRSFSSLLGADLHGAHLTKADLSEANLKRANLNEADLRLADLSGAHLHDASLFKANLREALLSGAKLIAADLFMADLSGADLKRANLSIARLVHTDLTGADLTGCCVYGASAWGLKLEGTKQQNLIITKPPEEDPWGANPRLSAAKDEPEITVDNIEVAQFIYLMLHNQKIRDVIDTITSKVVLILGRFTDERKAVLDALREELRKHNYLPILFDFDVPATRDITETVSLLARMARFVVADITNAKSIPQELSMVVPHLPSVPVQPLLLEGTVEYGMFEHFKRYPWVLETYRYPSSGHLIAGLFEHVIGPAEDYARARLAQDEEPGGSGR
jgi:hypothetical protein